MAIVQGDPLSFDLIARIQGAVGDEWCRGLRVLGPDRRATDGRHTHHQQKDQVNN